MDPVRAIYPFNPDWLARFSPRMPADKNGYMTVRSVALLLSVAGEIASRDDYGDVDAVPWFARLGHCAWNTNDIEHDEEPNEPDPRSCVTVVVPLKRLRRNLGVPTALHALKSVWRAEELHSHRTPGPYFLHKEAGGDIVFSIYGGRGRLAQAHPIFSGSNVPNPVSLVDKHERPRPDDAPRYVPQHVDLDVRQVAMFKTVYSIPFLTRFAAWRRSACRVGLKRLQHSFGNGTLRIDLPVEDMPAAFGFDMPQFTASTFRRFEHAIVGDLSTTAHPVHFEWSKAGSRTRSVSIHVGRQMAGKRKMSGRHAHRLVPRQSPLAEGGTASTEVDAFKDQDDFAAM